MLRQTRYLGLRYSPAPLVGSVDTVTTPIRLPVGPKPAYFGADRGVEGTIAIMPYEISWEQRGVVKRFWGHLTNADHRAAHLSVTQDSRLDDIRYVINDFTAVESHNIDEECLMSYLVDRIAVASYLPNIRGAFVATTPTMLSLCESICLSPHQSHQTKIFATIDDARRWLGC